MYGIPYESVTRATLVPFRDIHPSLRRQDLRSMDSMLRFQSGSVFCIVICERLSRMTRVIFVNRHEKVVKSKFVSNSKQEFYCILWITWNRSYNYEI